MFFSHISVTVLAVSFVTDYLWLMWLTTLIVTPALFIPYTHDGFQFLPVFAGLNQMSGRNWFLPAETQPCPRMIGKASRTSLHLLAGHNEERPIISQPQCGRCHWAGTGQTTLEKVIGSKQSYALNWCKPNNGDGVVYVCICLFRLSGR